MLRTQLARPFHTVATTLTHTTLQAQYYALSGRMRPIRFNACEKPRKKLTSSAGKANGLGFGADCLRPNQPLLAGTSLFWNTNENVSLCSARWVKSGYRLQMPHLNGWAAAAPQKCSHHHP